MVMAENKMKGNQRFYPCPHCGDQHPSLTTILGVIGSPALMGWMAKNGTAKLNHFKGVLEPYSKFNPAPFQELCIEAEKSWERAEGTAFWKSGKQIGQDAAEEGVTADAWLEAHFQGIPIDMAALGPKAKELVENALRWEKEHKVKTLFTQKTFFNCKLNYAGTADWGGEVDDELAILDWKRSGKFYFNHVIQAWSYALADETQHGKRLYGKVGLGSLGNAENPIRFFKRNDFPGIEVARDVLIACGHIFNALQKWDEAFPYKRKEKTKPKENVPNVPTPAIKD